MPRRAITTASSKPRTLAAIHPNAGLTAAYTAKLTALVDEMHRSLMRWVVAQYRATPPLAQDDAVPAADLTKRMSELGDKWLSRFDKAAPELGAWFATAAKDRSDFALADTLRRGGISVKFQWTPTVRDVFTGTVEAQVGLIKSIASEHLGAVQGAVMRSVQTGRDVGGLVKELEERFGVTRKRAVLIARHQNNVATATITKARQAELGITEAIWLHSGGGRHPRPTHVANSGKTYTIAKGWRDPATGDICWPGTAIGCRCVTKSIVPGLD